VDGEAGSAAKGTGAGSEGDGETMIGSAHMTIGNIAIVQMNGTAVRQLASKLMKAENDDHFLVFIQKFDSDIKPEPYPAVNVVFR
jgi:hypothetical protein